MGIRVSFSTLPALEPGERVLHFQPWVWWVSVKALPTYRLFFSLPPLWEAGLYITDSRILLAARLFRLLSYDYSVTLKNRQQNHSETLTEVSTGTMPVFRNYLELNTQCPRRHWFRSQQSRIRLFTSNAESLREQISQIQSA